MRKAQHKGKRVLASALCVGMLASMVPTQAFAADEQPVAGVVQIRRAPWGGRGENSVVGRSL